MARRRRTLFLSWCLFSTLLWFSSFLLGVFFRFTILGFGHVQSSFPGKFQSTTTMTPSRSAHRQRLPGSDLFSGISQKKIIPQIHFSIEVVFELTHLTDAPPFLGMPVSPPLLASKPLSPVKRSSFPFTYPPPFSRHSGRLNDDAMMKLGFWLLGMFQFSPLVSSPWPSYESGGPLPNVTRSMSVFKILLVNHFGVLRQHIVSSCRRLPLLYVSPLVQDLTSHHSIDLKQVHSPFTSRVRSISLFGLEHLCVFFFMGHPNPLRSSSSTERSITLSSSIEERPIPLISLVLRGDPFPYFARKSFFTAMHSYVKIYTGPEDATDLIPVRTEVWNYVLKSHGKVTILKSFDRIGLKFVSLLLELIFGCYIDSSHALSNFVKFVYLSLYRLVGLIVITSCFAYRICPMMLFSFVTD